MPSVSGNRLRGRAEDPQPVDADDSVRGEQVGTDPDAATVAPQHRPGDPECQNNDLARGDVVPASDMLDGPLRSCGGVQPDGLDLAPGKARLQPGQEDGTDVPAWRG